MKGKKLTYKELEKQNAELKKQNKILRLDSKTEIVAIEAQYHLLFENSLDGFAYGRLIFENGFPSDFIYLAVNPAFERLLGLQNVTGRKFSEVIPGFIEKNSELFQTYGPYALTGMPIKFDTYIESLNYWLSVSLIFPDKRHFIAIFDDITERKQAEEKLKESKEKYKNLVNHSPDIIYKFSNKRGGLFWSERIKDILGFNPEEIQDNPFLWNSSIHPDDKAAVQQAIENHGKGTDYNIEYRIRTKTGKWIWLHDSFMYKTQIDDEIIIEGHASDITSRKEAELALKKNEEYLRIITDNLPVLISHVNRDFKYLFVNNAYTEVFGIPRHKIIGKSIVDIIGEETFNHNQKHLDRLFSGETIKIENRIFDHNKQERIFQIVLVPEFNHNTVIGFFMLGMDITELKQSEKALRANEFKLSTILQNSSEAIGLHVNGVWMMCNAATLRLFGLTSQNELLGKSILNVIVPDERKRINDFVRSRMEDTGAPTEYLTRGLRADSTEFEMEVTLSSFLLESKRHVFVILRDITDRKRAEEALRKSETRYRLLFENMTNGFSVHEVITDKKNNPIDFRFIEVNKYYKDFSGLDQNEVKGKTIREMIPDVDIEMVQKYCNVALTGEPLNMEYFSKAYNKYIKVNCYSPQKGIFASIFEDITNSKQAEVILKESEEKFRLLNNMFSEILKLQDLDSIYKYITVSLQKRLPNAIILFVSINEKMNDTKLETVAGLNNELLNKILSISGFNPIGKRYKLVKTHNDYFRSGQLVEFKGGLAEFSASEFPVLIARTIEKLIGLHKIYTIGISKDDSLLAAIHFFTFNNTVINDGNFIETFVKQVGIIMQNRLSEEALKASEEKFRLMLKNSNDVLILADEKGIPTYISDKTKNAINFSNKDLSGPITNVIYKEDLNKVLNAWNRVLENKNEAVRVQYRHKDNKDNWFEAVAQNYLENPMIKAIVINIRNISENKIAELKIKESEEKLKEAQAIGKTGHWEFDLINNRIVWSDGLYKIMGLQNNEFTPTFETFLNYIHPEDRELVLNTFNNHLSTHAPTKIIHRIILASGEIKHVKVRINTYFDFNGKPAHSMCTIIDITERINYENELIKAKEEIEAGKAQITAMLEALPDIMFIQNKDGVFIDYHSPESEKLYLSPEKFIGKRMNDLLPPELVAEFEKLSEAAVRTKLVQLHEYSLQMPNGIKHFEARLISYDENKILSIIRNITDRKQAEELIKQTRKNYETFFNTIDDFLFVLDEQGNIIHTNDTVLKRLEYSKEELYGYSVLMIHPPERREEAARIVEEMLAKKTEFCLVPVMTKFGDQIAVETKVTYGFWNGKPVIFGVAKDISKLKLSEEMFSKAFRSNPTLMALSFFETGSFIEVNDTFLKVLGYSKDEVIGKTAKELNLYANFKDRVNIIDSLKNGEEQIKIEIDVNSKIGSKRTGLFKAERIYIGHDLCLFTTMIDITEQRKAEQTINEQNKELIKLNTDKDRFISILAHDLKNPFSVLLGFSELLIRNIDKYNSDKIKDLVIYIHDAAQNLYSLLEDILNWANSQSGKLIYSPQRLILANICREVLSVLKLNIDKKNIEIKNLIEDEFQVLADANMLKTIFRNLVSNAIKFSNTGGQINIYAEKELSNVVISISDNGIGIDPDKLSKIFDIAYSHSSKGTAKESGTGLGLILCKEFVEKHGGTITVESEIGKGSTFKFTIPLIIE